MVEGTERSIELDRTGRSTYRATNVRGGTINIGEGQNTDFTPIELLLVAIAGCSALTIEALTTKRVDAETFTVTARADKIRDELGNRLADVKASFSMTFPAGPEGDRARQTMPRAVTQTHDRLCTVVRSIVTGTPIAQEWDNGS